MRQSPDVYLFPDDADFCLINGVPVLIQLDGRAPRFSAVRAAKQIDPVFDIRLLLSAALRDDNVVSVIQLTEDRLATQSACINLCEMIHILSLTSPSDRFAPSESSPSSLPTEKTVMPLSEAARR